MISNKNSLSLYQIFNQKIELKVMKRTKTYNGLLLQAILILPEGGLLAGSKDDVVVGENTEVVIDEQIGGADIEIGEWD